MANFKTPQHIHEVPSVFMTPSSSCGRPVFQKPRSLLTPLSISFPSPVHTPLVTKQEHKDILIELFEQGFPLLAKRILSLLSEEDIAKCLFVSHSWYNFITQLHIQSSSEVPKKLTTDENISALHMAKKSLSATRQPLMTIVNASKETIRSLPRRTVHILPGPVKMRPCPKCQSPAKQLNLRRAECTKCTFDFCQNCFCSWHEDPSCGTHAISLSPKKKESVLMAGTKKSKKRLKRL